MTRRVLMGSAGLLLAQVLHAQNSGGGSKVALKHDLPDVSLKGWAVTAVEVRYGPGESSAAHRHPGITIGYVLEGEIRSKIGDGPEQTYTPGQMFFENPGELHGVYKAGETFGIIICGKREAVDHASIGTDGYSPAPVITIGIVGVTDPASGSMVIANAFASTPGGSGGLTTVALPRAFGLNTPAGIGAPWVGINHNSKAFCGGRLGMLLAMNTKLDLSRT